MANKMLIDATHPEETRVVVLRGNRVEEFDFESAHRKQLRGNIYLAKVTRVEPSLQAAFVDYGGNRHGFLAFSEIHPDYYQIPIADRQALIAEEERAQRAAMDDVERVPRRTRESARSRRDDDVVRGEAAEPLTADILDGGPSAAESAGSEGSSEYSEGDPETGAPREEATSWSFESPEAAVAGGSADQVEAGIVDEAADAGAQETQDQEAQDQETQDSVASAEEIEEAVSSLPAGAESDQAMSPTEAHSPAGGGEDDDEVVESVGGADALEEVPDRAPRYRRQYKIQEVIKRRQVMLVQVVKEERGTKGAALTTYLSLAGRYSVLMPNTARGGGISRKITNPDDRARLREAAADLEVPEGMGVILRTAGASRTKIEIKRDFEYLLRMWETVRDLTLKSTAPKLVYEEGSLVKRSLRDLYGKDIDEVLVAGGDAYQEAKDFMRMLMPSHAKNVKLYTDSQPLLSRYGVENQLDAMFSPVVQLRSGGYVVLNQAEALVAIDVNSGRATREHHIEDTAFKTNLEAADEIARQLRLRDLAGLIVIDFIDMDEKRNNRSVERRLKECLRHDRARIQVGRISHFGLLEMSRQRIRTSVLESSTEKCPYCGGSGHVRSVSSLALQVLRALEDQLIRGATHNLIARTRPDVALYVLNQKRAHLRGLEDRFAITITVTADETVRAPQTFVVDRGEQVHTAEAAKAIAERAQAAVAPLEEEDDLEEIGGEAGEAEPAEFEAETAMAGPASDEAGDGGSRRRRRRRRRGRGGGEPMHGQNRQAHAQSQPHVEQIAITESAHDHAAEPQDLSPQDLSPQDLAADEAGGEAIAGFAAEPQEGRERREPREEARRDDRRRRRGRRGGRRNRQRNGEGYAAPEQSGQYGQGEFVPAEQFASPPATEPELSHAVADLDSPPAERAAPPDVPVAMPPVAMPPAAVEQPEPSRRRSTVREPAPATGAEVGGGSPASAPSQGAEPVITETGEASEGERPRRTGWWSRRFAGG
ncbi:MAG: Rne/Rng family ribonuclease [Xanthobacteraceae bacterium]